MTESALALLVSLLPGMLAASTGDGNRPGAVWRVQDASNGLARDASGNGHTGRMAHVEVHRQVEQLGDPPCFVFGGTGASIETANAPGLNPERLSLAVWFKYEGGVSGQTPLLVKSCPVHKEPWYQYGLFVINQAAHPECLTFYADVNGQACIAQAPGVLTPGWHHAAATYDGETMRLYLDGRLAAENAQPSGPVTRHDTPLLIGAYANLPKTPPYCFKGAIASAALYPEALDGDTVGKLYAASKEAFPAPADPFEGVDSEYAKRVNGALRCERDVWGETVIASGGATYEKVKDYLRPLFYSTGHKNTELGVHNLLFGEDGGEGPYLVPLADGSRIAANVYQAKRDIRFFLGADGREAYGDELDRLEGPFLEDGFWPVLETAYTDASGAKYAQESFAGWVDGVDHLVAFIRMSLEEVPGGEAGLCVRLGEEAPGQVRYSREPRDRGGAPWFTLDAAGQRELYLVWSPEDPLPTDLAPGPEMHASAKEKWKGYWRERLENGTRFDVPERLVMDCQRNLLVQNLMMRWRYSLGSVVYHGSFYQPESSDAATTLGLYGYADAYRGALETLLPLTKGHEQYRNWELGEKLTHNAHYYLLTRDTAFIERNTAAYLAICTDFKQQIETGPHGLLQQERQCGDIAEKGYFLFHQAVCWRGLRDMAEVWRLTGREDLHAEFAPLAGRLRTRLLEESAACRTQLEDGTLFIPRLLRKESPPLRPITETRTGSYWNLVMPYGFDSGLWDPTGEDMGRIVDFMHEHGSTMLGLLRFNYYPTPIGSFRAGGLPGYYTTGFDNVYLPSYQRMLAKRDEAERLILSFYGKLAHGQTRHTFVCGEGDTVGPRPSEYYRSCYGGPCSANNAAFLVPLRWMLVRESFNNGTGLPENLYLTHATPRHWLEDGKQVRVVNAPACFGPVSFTVTSFIAAGRVEANVTVPSRNPPTGMFLKLRVPGGMKLSSVTVNGRTHGAFDADGCVIGLTGCAGQLDIDATFE